MKAWILSLPINLITHWAELYNVDPVIIIAIVSIESSGQTCATRYEPNYRWTLPPEPYAKMNRVTVETELVNQRTSFGLMQVMGAVARENNFNGYLTELCKPEVGLKYGVIHFKKFLDKYKNTNDAISAYNQGSPRKFEDSGEYKNQYYVNKVNSRINDLRKL